MDEMAGLRVSRPSRLKGPYPRGTAQQSCGSTRMPPPRTSEICELPGQICKGSFRLGQKRLRADGRARRACHPDIGGHVADRRHSLELRADGARLLHLAVDLERDHVADRIVREIKERADHVRIYREQRDIALLEDRSVVAVPT